MWPVKSIQKLIRLMVYGLPSLALFASPVFAQNSASGALASDPVAQPQEPGSKPETEMLLVCEGSRFTLVPTSQTNAIVTDNRGNLAVGSATSSAPANVAVQVRLHVKEGVAEMQVPSLGGPAFVFVVNAGWYSVKNLIFGDDEISGKVKFGVFDSSKFRIDRRTGAISLQSVFAGTCRKEDLQKRAF